MSRRLAAVLAGLLLVMAGPADAKPRKAKRTGRSASVGTAATLRLGAPRWRVTAPRAVASPATPLTPGVPPAQAPAAAPNPFAPAPVVPSGPLPRAVSAATADRNGLMRLTLSSPAVAAGTVAVEFNNAFAEDPHDLHVVQESGSAAFAFAELGPGLASSRDLQLEPGTYLLLCALPGHAAAGMKARLRVEAR